MKRLTDADKWEDPWFVELDPQAKLFWLYLLDKVDQCGVWEKFEKKFQFDTGIGISIDALIEDLGDRVCDLGDKILIPKFIRFQYGQELSESSNFHKGIFKRLDHHGLEMNGQGLVKGMPRVSLGYIKGKPRVGLGLVKGTFRVQDKDKDKDKDKNIRGSAEGDGIPEELNTPEFREAWDAYLAMRKENKWATLKPSSLKARFKEFKEHGIEESIRALEESVRQGWRGVFPGNQQAGQHDDNDRNYDDPLSL